MRWRPIIALGAFAAGCTQPPVGTFDFPEGSVQHVVAGDAIPWGACPPNLPSGCEIAVLEGDPQAADLFTVRFRLAATFVRPRTHTQGTSGRPSSPDEWPWPLGRTRDDATAFGPGAYYVNARNAIHTVWAAEPSVIQLTGIGPWEAHFVEGPNH